MSCRRPVSNSTRILATTLMAGFISTPAWAQLEEIVVTAQKRAQSLQDVPITMQAFSGEDLNSLGAMTASDITKLAPNMAISAQNGIAHQIVIRGVGTSDFFGNAPGSVGLYMDEVTMSAPFLGGLGLYDMERVEVLRGPQNSLFGRNTTGGAINYITNKPDVGGEVEGYLRGVYGNYDRTEVEGGVSIPLGESAAMRLSGMSYQRDGVWNNLDNGKDYGEQDRYSYRATFRWEPGENTSIIANFHSAREDSESPPALAVGAVNSDWGDRLTAADILPVSKDLKFDKAYDSVNSQGLNPSTGDWEDIYKTGANKLDIEVDGAYLKLEHNFEAVTFTGIVSYDEVDTLYTEDDGSSGNIRGGAANRLLVIDMDQHYEQTSAELRLMSTGDGPFHWITGLYYYSEDSLLSQNISFGDNGTLGFNPYLVDPDFFDSIGVGIDQLPNGWPPGMPVVGFSVAELENTVWSPYFHTEYELREDMNVTFGLRYTDDKKKNPSYLNGAIDMTGMPPETFYSRHRVEQMAASLGECPPIDFMTVLPFLSAPCANDQTDRDDLHFKEWGGKVGMDWFVNEDIMLYGSYSRGFKSGKYDIEFLHTDVTPFPQDPVDVETLDAFEVGYKSTLMDGAMQFNGAFFYSIWKDRQTFNVGPAGPEFVNLPESEIYGLEFELQWAVTDTLLFTGGLGMLDTEITDTGTITAAKEGHELPNSPGLTVNGVIVKDIPMGDSVLALQTDFQFVDDNKVNMAPQPGLDEYESRFTINARATYSFGAEEQYQVAVFGENLTEERYCVAKVDLQTIAGTYYCTPNDGQRFYGVEARVKF